MIDSIIFDVDGTLWDCTDTVAQAWNDMFEKEPDINIRLTGDDLKKLFGKLSGGKSGQYYSPIARRKDVGNFWKSAISLRMLPCETILRFPMRGWKTC